MKLGNGRPNLEVGFKKYKRRGMQQTRIDQAKLVTDGNIGKANLCDVISYGSRNSFLKDKSKHFASYQMPFWRRRDLV